MSETVIDTQLDDETCERLDAIADEITPGWMDDTADRAETIKYLARHYHGEVE